MHRQVDRAQLVPGELVGAGAVAERPAFRRRRRSRPARSRGGRRSERSAEVLRRVGWGTAMSELENWCQARPPKAIAATIASDRRAAAHAPSAPAGRGRARPRCRVSRPRRAPPAAQARRRGASESGDPGEQDQQHGDALVDGCLSGRGCRRGCAWPAPRAPPAARRARRSPASPAARGGRARGRACRPAATARASRPPRE